MNEMVMTEELFHKKEPRQVVIITGLSGAGKTSVMRALEDLDFYCIDNLPLPLLTAFLDFAFSASSNIAKVAFGIDARSQKFLKDFMIEVHKLKQRSNYDCPIECKIIFVTSSDDIIIRRFQETRRKHPLGRGVSIREAIMKEKELLEPIYNAADVILDTDSFNVQELRHWIRRSYSREQQEVVVNLISFGFKYGVPPESSLVYDVRFLPNPYFIPAIRHLDGRDEKIQSFLFELPEVQEYWRSMTTFLHYSLQKSREEGRFFVNVAFGCTGGRHRSVAMVERCAQQTWPHMRFVIHHRDVKKESKQ